jgi:uncharacterized protein YlxP (DUF503 family)
MFVAATQLVLDYYGNCEVSKKQEELQKLITELKKAKFNLSIGEVADFQDPERCSLGLALVASTEGGARSAMKKILEYIDGHSFARVIIENTEIEKY